MFPKRAFRVLPRWVSGAAGEIKDCMYVATTEHTVEAMRVGGSAGTSGTAQARTAAAGSIPKALRAPSLIPEKKVRTARAEWVSPGNIAVPGTW